MHGNSGDWAICCGSRNTRGPISDAVKAKPGVGSQDQRQPLTVAEKSPFSVSQCLRVAGKTIVSQLLVRS
ncbi:rCG60693, isoform CRA_b [Rattus norvegicus]|uniref:RCG60693, isoform CRA_b n=1 Tax=Rattus norvegicus TaxID=10116 RepID=A6JJK9_RAT|nr:rCG60693, isoform CRA_b [Rattus norvegicus]